MAKMATNRTQVTRNKLIIRNITQTGKDETEGVEGDEEKFEPS